MIYRCLFYDRGCYGNEGSINLLGLIKPLSLVKNGCLLSLKQGRLQVNNTVYVYIERAGSHGFKLLTPILIDI